ncbi:pleckstrin homology (PH) domain-containing protein / lipid-binding START domain-containing protein [Striga asiatica]|uniref:Pleckstrin homology (PH) domain-containing protein / lipid-binding START domain-containing protein n=1 Tax=Striga asiatica TaxID=4170 RepID=A0A5A7P579_STRAF|nr:pleckstrin homology (PH) domain-containing protein / lipid-binding START domain-containing protein [Striga asiatica]
MVWKLREKNDMDPPEYDSEGETSDVENDDQFFDDNIDFDCSICKQPNHNSRGCHKNPQSRPTNQGLDVPAATTNGKEKESQTNKQSQTEPVISGKGKRNKRGFEVTSTGFEGAPNGKRKKNKEKGSGVNVPVVVTNATSSAPNGEGKSASTKSKLNIFTQEKRMTRSSTCGKPMAFTQPIGQNPRSSRNNVRFSTTKPPVTSSQTSANQVPPKEPPPKRVTRSSTFSPKKSQQK